MTTAMVTGPPDNAMMGANPSSTPGGGGKLLFSSVKYYLATEVPDDVKMALKEGGGKREFYISDLITHVIASNENFSEKDECLDRITVRPLWVTLSHKRGYLLPTQPFSVLPMGLFGGLTFCTSGIRNDDYLAVWSMIRWNGGNLVKALSMKTTHLIVGSTQSQIKYKAAIANNIPVVVIEWLLECITQGAILPTDNYRLHIPGETPPRRHMESPGMGRNPSTLTPNMPQSVPLLARSPLVSQQNVIISPNHSMGQPMVAQSPVGPMLTSPIEEKEEKKRQPKKTTKKKKEPVMPYHMPPMMPPGAPPTPGAPGPPGGRFEGGSYPPTPSPHPSTPHPPTPHTPSTVSPDRFGIQSPYMVSNSPQFFQYQQQQNMMRQQQGYPPPNMSRQQWAMYQQQLMQQQQQKQGYFNPNGQFPGSQQGMPGHMASFPGGRPPGSLPAGIYPPQVAHPPSMIPNQAQAPKAVPTPPPDYIEKKESRFSTLRNCTLMLIDYPDYYSKDVIHKWKVVIEEHGGTVATFYNPEFVTHVICMSRMSDIYKRALEDKKCVTTAHWLNDVVTDKEYILPCNPLHIPTQFKTGLPDCAKMKISVTGYEGKERIYVKDMIRVIGAVYTGELSQQNTHLISRKSEGLKYTKAQKWGTKIVNARWLSDIVLYGVVSVTTEKKYTQLGDPKELILQDTVMPKLIKCWHDFFAIKKEADIEPNSKKLKPSFSSPVVLFTGLPSDKNQKLSQMLKKMRCKLTSDVREATHLVTVKIVRTVKFLAAISKCKFIVTPAWVEQSYSRKILLDETPYILDDKENERNLGFCVKESLQKARKYQVFTDLEVLLTPRIQPGPKDMSIIVECGGGKVINEAEAAQRLSQPAESRKKFYVVSCSQDQSLCQQFYQKDIQIYTSEFILSGALTQQLDLNSNKLFVAGSEEK